MSSPPPHDIAAEEAVLGSLMIGSDLTLDEIPELTKDHFYSGKNRNVFAAIVQLHAVNEPINVVNVASKMVDLGSRKEGALVAELIELCNGVPALTVGAFQSFARTVLHRSLSRDLIDIARKTIATVECGIGDPSALMAETEQAIHKLSQGHGESTLTTMKAALRTAFNALKEHAARVGPDGGASGTPYGFAALDENLGGLHEGDLTIVAGRPGSGKSAFAMAVARNISARGDGALMLSLEMGNEQIALRALCSESKVDMNAARFGRFTEREWTSMAAVMGAVVSGGPFFLDDNGAMTLAEIRSRTRKVQRECAREGRKLGVVVVDYIQLVNHKGDNREQVIAEISRTLKLLARETKVPVIALSQLNRGVENRADKRPMMSDLRESGAIEQDADNILMLYRDDYYDKNSRMPGIMEVGIVKQRSGPTTTQPLGFDAKTVRFRTLSQDEWIAWDDIVNPKQKFGVAGQPRRARGAA